MIVVGVLRADAGSASSAPWPPMSSAGACSGVVLPPAVQCRWLRQPDAEQRDRATARTSRDRAGGHVPACMPAVPIRGPKNTISVNETSGSSQASRQQFAASVVTAIHQPLSSSAWSTSTVAWLL